MLNAETSEGGRLVSDILHIMDTSELKSLLITVDIQKVFDSVNHLFLVSLLEKKQKQPTRGDLKKKCSENSYAANLQENTHAEVRFQ